MGPDLPGEGPLRTPRLIHTGNTHWAPARATGTVTGKTNGVDSPRRETFPHAVVGTVMGGSMGSCKSTKQALSQRGQVWGRLPEEETGLKGSLEEQAEVAWETIERRCEEGDMSG